jgi:hypothetical protein
MISMTVAGQNVGNDGLGRRSFERFLLKPPQPFP